MHKFLRACSVFGLLVVAGCGATTTPTAPPATIVPLTATVTLPATALPATTVANGAAPSTAPTATSATIVTQVAATASSKPLVPANPTMNPTEKILYATIAARPTSTTPPTPSPLVALPVAIEGPISVVSNSYSTGQTNYDTTVIFRIKNPNADITATAIPFRVTIKGGGGELYTSDGKDTVGVPPGVTRLVLFNTNGIVGGKPDSAEIRLYPAPSMYAKAQSDIVMQSDWSITGTKAQCGSYNVECSLNADLQWNGQGNRGRVRVMAVAHSGGDINGPIVAAGVCESSDGMMAPGQVAPITGTLAGFTQPQVNGGAILPPGQITYEFYVESAGQR